MEAAEAADLRIIVRPRPDFVNTPPAIDASIKAAADIGAETVVFAGTEVLGYKGLLEYAAQKIQAVGLQFGYIELVPQDGENGLARHLDYRVIRVHSISEPEMIHLSPQRALDRFSLAARERKVRLCYVHLFFTQGDLLTANVDYVKALTSRLRADGFTLGTPRPFEPLTIPRWSLPLIFAALGAALLWLVQAIVGLSAAWFWVTTALVLLTAAGAGISSLGAFRPFAALSAALIFPLWALLSIHFREQPARHPVLSGTLLFLRVSLITAAGGLLVAGCLTESSYLVKIQQFRGVKLAELLPLVIIAMIFAARSMPGYWDVRTELGDEREEGPALRAGLREAFNCVVRYWHVVAVIVGLATVAILLLRSGNEPGLGVSGLEMKLRALLDRLLVVRPRSKEIFFAHPLMILSLILLARGQRHGLWIGLAAGAIGQVSIMNTFCHLHTPLAISLLRVGNGLWIGIIGGLILWLIVWWVGGLGRRVRE